MLSAYRVLDLSDERGHLCGHMLASLGAEVIAIEPPGGSSARWIGPFAGDDPGDGENSLNHWAHNRGKKSVVIDYATPEGREQLLTLVDGADFLIESMAPGEMDALGLSCDELAARNPALITVAITPFGSEGPKANWHVTDLTIVAAGGQMAITGDEDRAPLRISMPQAYHHAASEGASAALIALYERQHRSGLGQNIDTSAQQSLMQASQSMMLANPLNATLTERMAGGVKLAGLDVQLAWPCKDGNVSVTFLFGAGIAPFTQNLMNWVCEEGFCDEATRDKDWVNYAVLMLTDEEPIAEYTRVKQCLADFFMTKTKAELFEASFSRRVLITPVATVEDVMNSEQLADRGFWEDVEHEGRGSVRYPGPMAKFTATPQANLPAAPKLGAHTDEVLAESARTPNVPEGLNNPSTDAPLAGLKVLDLMWVMAGPAGSRVLADYGAEIVRVESANKLDTARTLQPFRDDVTDPEGSGLYNNMNAGKQGLALDMSKPGALDVIYDLLDWADVVLESFSPKAMAGWGIGYEDLRKRKPDIIMLSSCLMGQSGPHAMLAGFGTMAAAISGFFYGCGWPDRPPAGPVGAYTDYVSPRFLTTCLMAAIEHRRVTGEGQYIDLSQGECSTQLLTPALLDWNVNGRMWERIANDDPDMSPHGVFPSNGDDKWVAIACRSDDEWRALAGLIGANDQADLGVEARRAAADSITEKISAWTSSMSHTEAQDQLQALGVAAHRVQNSDECVTDPQLQYRGHFVTVPHGSQPDGTTVVEASRFGMSRTPAIYRGGGPTIGQHTFEVLTEILEYDVEKVGDIAAAELLE